ncbi:hypothetical protein OROHE_000630 [Orobanche hederae]
MSTHFGRSYQVGHVEYFLEGLSPFWEIIPEEEENIYIQEQGRNDMLPPDDINDMQTDDEVKGPACMLNQHILLE